MTHRTSSSAGLPGTPCRLGHEAVLPCATAVAALGITRDHLDEDVPAKMNLTLGRVGETDEVAEAVSFSVSQQTHWIAGPDLVVDGGAVKTA